MNEQVFNDWRKATYCWMQIILSGALIGSKIQKINPTSKVGGNLKETHMYRKKCRRLEIAMVGRKEKWRGKVECANVHSVLYL